MVHRLASYNFVASIDFNEILSQIRYPLHTKFIEISVSSISVRCRQILYLAAGVYETRITLSDFGKGAISYRSGRPLYGRFMDFGSFYAL